MIARLDIRLVDLKPLVVQRRLEVPLTIRLDRLHLVFQAVMGWQNTHQYAFWPGRPYQSTPYIGTDSDEDIHRPADEITLAKFMTIIPTTTFVYTYDFGDDWHHSVRVAVADRQVNTGYPRIVSAVGRCPPEDIGGPSRYAAYIIANPEYDARTSDIAGLQDRLSKLYAL